MKKIAIMVFCVAVLMCSITDVRAVSCEEARPSVEHYEIESGFLNTSLAFDVYVPPCMDPRILGGYPVLYLLHGQDMGIETWQQMRIDELLRNAVNVDKVPLFLIVVPQEDYFLTSISLSEYGNAVLFELMPWIETKYNTCTKRECRGISGLSRGALWAELLAFEHPALFGSAALLSMPGTILDDQSLYYLAERQSEDEKLRIRIDVGSEDNYRHEASRASGQLTFIGYPYEFNIQPGAHDMAYWRSMLPEYFVWFSKGWPDFSSPEL